MSGALSLDTAATARLATLDPSLSALPLALPPASTGSTWKLHDVRWSPGQGCRLAYRETSTAVPPTFVGVDVAGSDCKRYDYREDPRLPGLAAATDPGEVSAWLSRALGRPVHGCRVEPVRYRPGSRCVLRYQMRTAGQPLALYAKAVTPESFSTVCGVSRRIGHRPGGAGIVAETVAEWPETHVVVTESVPGRPASDVLGDQNVPATERARLARRIGELLASFHEQTDVPAPTWTPQRQLTRLWSSLDAVRLVEPAVGRRILETLDALADAPPAVGARVLGHGSLRAGQVLVTTEGDLVVLDLDEVSWCHPERDLAGVLSHLTWQGLRQPQHAAVLRTAERAFLGGYARQARAEPQPLTWWRAAALLQVAVRRYRRLEAANWRLVPHLVDAAEALVSAEQARAATGGAVDPSDTRRLTRLLRGSPGAASAVLDGVRVESAQTLTVAPGRRAVVRYQLRGLDGPRPVAVIGKSYRDPDRARLVYEHLTLLCAGPFGQGPLQVPQPLALLPQHGMVLYRACDGTLLDRLAGETREAGVRAAARWLARLHGSDVPLARRFYLPREESSTRQWAAVIARLDPASASAAHRLADRWAAAAGCLPVSCDVPIHKDFHPGHVLIGDHVVVLDLDEARQGNPAFDVAHFCAYLELGEATAAGRARLARVFLDEYRRAAGTLDGAAYAAFGAYSWLKIGKQAAIGSGPWRGTRRAPHRTEVARALAKGEECLDR